MRNEVDNSETLEDILREDNPAQARVVDSKPSEVEHLIEFGIKEGYISEDARNWSNQQKEDYYNKCQDYEDGKQR
jgi:hypothetical protein